MGREADVVAKVRADLYVSMIYISTNKTFSYKKLGLTARLSRPSGGVQKDLTRPALASSAETTAAQLEARIIRDIETGEVQRVEYISKESALDVQVAPTTRASTNVVKQLEEYASRGERTKERTQSEREKDWIKELVRVHGDDYQAMAHDQKRNVWQQSAGDLRKRVSKYKAHNDC